MPFVPINRGAGRLFEDNLNRMLDELFDNTSVLSGLTASTAELNHLDGVTSNIQTQLDGKASVANVSGAASAQATTSGSFFSVFTIPAGQQEITFHFRKVSLSAATSALTMRLGTPSGFVSSGYDGIGQINGGSVTAVTNGIPIVRSAGSDEISGQVTWRRLEPGSNIWTCSYCMGGSAVFQGGGSIDLGGEAAWGTLVRVGGSDTFDGGSFNVSWRI